MSFEVSVKIPSLAAMVGRLKHFQQDQLPYALSVGMNRAAKDARDKFRSHFASVFQLRSKNLHRAVGPFGSLKTVTTGGAGSTADGWSHKSQWPNLRVVFGSESYGLARQELGGVKPNVRPEVWIPTRHVQYTSGGKKLGRHTPSKLRRKLATVSDKTGRAKKQSGGERVFIRNRTVYERSKGERKALPLYLIRDRANVPPIMNLDDLISATYQAKLFPRFSQAMKAAMADGPKRTKK